MTYAGDVRPTEAWGMLAREANALLVDMRIRPERVSVGVPDLSSISESRVPLSRREFPDMEVAPDFSRRPADETPSLVLRRGGAWFRAAAAAMTAQGHNRRVDPSDGSEGNLEDDLEADRHRGKAAGWKAAGLPWMQDWV